MANNSLLLSTVAFGMSLGLGLLVIRDFQKAFVTGLITIPATFCAVGVVNRKQRLQQEQTWTELQMEIHQMERWEAQLHHSLSAIAAEERRAEVNLNALRSQLHQLYFQVAEQQKYRYQLGQDLMILSEQRHQVETESLHWQTQVHSLEQQKEELDLSLRSMKAEKYKVEISLKSLQTELKDLQDQVAEHLSQKEEIKQDLTLLQRLKPQLELVSLNLQTQIQELESRKAQLNQSLFQLSTDQQTAKAYLDFLQAQLNQLKTSGKESLQLHIPDQFGHKLLPAQVQNGQTIEVNETRFEYLNSEWSEFIAQLPNAELQVLRAITKLDNPNSAIKKIAEENITMPELLIADINERALAIIGDLIIEPGSVPPTIAETGYLENLREILKIDE